MECLLLALAILLAVASASVLVARGPSAKVSLPLVLFTGRNSSLVCDSTRVSAWSLIQDGFSARRVSKTL